ncbi:MAG: hypothetical protein LBN22_11780 [Clostridiales Family XIII bacterium]|nr:hypothetical protein [Clostridiales Family XIII bacterium]
MKKLITILLAATMLLAMPIAASAATDGDVISAVSAGVTYQGVTKTPTATQIADAQKFLAAGGYSATELDTILKGINDAKAAYAQTGKIDDNIISIASKTASAVGATFTFNGKTATIVDRNGNTLTVSTPAAQAAGTTDATVSIVKTAAGTSPVKQTGSDNVLPVAAGGALLIMLGAAFVIASKKGLFVQ